MMEMKVCWLYHDIMDLYGDRGNMMVLKKRCEDRGIQFVCDTCDIGEERDIREYDLLFLGGGADKEQILLMPDLLSRKENIVEAMEQGTFAFLVCGGYQLFGQYYIAGNGEKVEGLKIKDYYTNSGEEGKRCIGNVVIDVDMDGVLTRVIGFENHGGQTENVTHPWGTTVKGYGNTFTSGKEGYYDGTLLGTYLHGPLLPKNPKIADMIITKSLQKRNPDFTFDQLEEIDSRFEKEAREVMMKRLEVPYQD